MSGKCFTAAAQHDACLAGGNLSITVCVLLKNEAVVTSFHTRYFIPFLLLISVQSYVVDTEI